MYDVDQKKKERREERSLRVDGETYPRKAWTVGLDQQIEPVRQRIVEIAEEYRKQTFITAHLTEEGEQLPEGKRHSDRKIEAAEKRMRELDEEGIECRFELIAMLVDKSETDQALTIDALRANLELEDLGPIVEMLQFGEQTVGGPVPISAPSSD